MTHVPVLLEPAVEYLAIAPDGIYVDATFGAGGHSRAILSHLTVGAIDCPGCGSRGGASLPRRFPIRVLPSSTPTFAISTARSMRCGVAAVDGVLFDFGVSSMQFDDPERGFSIGKPAPLDMRMNPHVGRSAYDMLATASERELADIFFYYGEERAARRIARAIVEPPHRRGAAEYHHRVCAVWSPASFTARAGASEFIRRRASFKRCVLPSTTSSTRCGEGCAPRSRRLRGCGARRRNQLSLA